MSEKLKRVIEIPEGVEANLEGSLIKVKGPKGELERDLSFPNIAMSKEDNKITIETKLAGKQEIAIVGTFESHVLNMIKGVTDGFTYKLKAVYSHFPMTLKQVGNLLEIHNFLGEKAPRKSKVVGNAKVNLEKDMVIVEGINKEEAGQTAANLELATRVKRKDTRVFQDGVYIVERP